VFASVHQFPEVPFHRAAVESLIQTTLPGEMPLATPTGVFGGSLGTNRESVARIAACDAESVFRMVNIPIATPQSTTAVATTDLFVL
jgi:dihydroxyacetone kinase DhaKLM complex PTS-EIIA-like component DhaM